MYLYVSAGSAMASATFAFRFNTLSFTRPRAVLMITCAPSQSNQTGVTCGEPSLSMSARNANAFVSHLSRYRAFSGISTIVRLPRSAYCVVGNRYAIRTTQYDLPEQIHLLGPDQLLRIPLAERIRHASNVDHRAALVCLAHEERGCRRE